MTDKKKNNELKETKPEEAIVRNKSNLLLVWFCATLIAIITGIVFSPSLQNDFTNWDDPVYIKNNPLVSGNSVPLVKIFETPVSGHYHPLTILSLAMNYRLGKLNPFGYHLENVILHILNTILVFFFVFLLTRRNLLMAAVVSLFFGIHPMHVESVSWISERKDVLYVLFFVAGLITYLRYSETKKIIWYLFTFLLFMLSCLSKEMAIVFPVILLLIDYLKGVEWKRRLFIEKIPFFLLAILLGVIEVNIQSGNEVNNNNMKIFTLFHRFLFASYAPIMYMVRLFVPYKLSAFYPYPDVLSDNGIPLIFYFSPFILLGILLVLVYFFIKKEKEIVFGLLFYFVSILLVVQFIPINPYIVPDRYSYLSYIGLLFIVAYFINKLWQSKNNIMALFKYPPIIIVVIGAIVFSCQTYSRTQVWKNSETLWTDVIDNYPKVSVAYKARGDYYYDIHKIEKAIYDYNKAIEFDSGYAGAYTNRGILYLNTGKINRAIADFDKAIALDSTDADAYNNRALFYLNTGKTNLAIADCNKSIALNPNSASCYYNRGIIYSALVNKKDSAIAYLTKAIELDSTYADAYNNRGLLYVNTGKTNLALADFTKAILLDSNNASAYSNRAFLYLSRGKNDSVLVDCSKAIAHDPKSALYYYNRALFYKTVNQYEKAVDDFTTGIQLNPKNVEVYYYMRGICNVNLQKYNESVADFSKAIELNPSVADYWLSRSFAESKIGQHEAAKADALNGQQLQGKY